MTTGNGQPIENTDEDRQAAIAAGEAMGHYVRRHLPDWLRPGYPEPKTWPFGKRVWGIIVESAGEYLQASLQSTFLGEFAQGWTLHEIVNGREYGTEVYADGRPKRRTVSEVPPTLEQEAHQVLAEAQRGGVRVDDMTLFTLERALDSPPAKVQAAVNEVRSLVRQHDLEKRAAQSDGVWITVHRLFTGPGHIEYPAGRQKVSAEELEGLRKWQEHVENQAAPRGGLENVGQHGVWPPFAEEAGVSS